MSAAVEMLRAHLAGDHSACDPDLCLAYDTDRPLRRRLDRIAAEESPEAIQAGAELTVPPDPQLFGPVRIVAAGRSWHLRRLP